MAYRFTQTGSEIQDILDLAELQLATPFNETVSYSIGDYCVYGNGYYVCIGATYGEWNAAKWSAVTIGDELKTQAVDIAMNASDIEALIGNPVYTGGGTVSTTSGTWTDAQSVTLTKGIYLIEYGISFSPNSNGARRIALTTSATAPSQGDRTMPCVAAVSGEATTLKATTMVNPSSTTTYHFWAFQSSGSNVNSFPYIRTMKLK